MYDHPTVSAVTAYLAGDQPAEAEAVPVAADEPVAIVAMSGRWPGGAHSPEELWEILGSGSDVISGFPANRGWDLAGLRTGSATGSGGFLHDADEFDAAFFGLSPREGHRHRSAAADPAFQSAWELYERVALDPSAQRGTRTGVYVGVTPHDFGPRLHEIPDDHQGHALTGTLTSAASGRIAYTLGLEGPAIPVERPAPPARWPSTWPSRRCGAASATWRWRAGRPSCPTRACSPSSAARAGWRPTGGASRSPPPPTGPRGRRVPGSCCWSRCRRPGRNGHPVLAVRGSAVNQDGASNGFTAPSGTAQQRVIRAALAVAGLAPGEVDAVEAHGTGTTPRRPDRKSAAILATYGRGT